MNKKEKELAALYISGCMAEMLEAERDEWPEKYERAKSDYKKFIDGLNEMLNMKWKLLQLDYEKSVIHPMQEIYRIALMYYNQRISGQQLKYPV